MPDPFLQSPHWGSEGRMNPRLPIPPEVWDRAREAIGNADLAPLGPLSWTTPCFQRSLDRRVQVLIRTKSVTAAARTWAQFPTGIPQIFDMVDLGGDFVLLVTEVDPPEFPGLVCRLATALESLPAPTPPAHEEPPASEAPPAHEEPPAPEATSALLPELHAAAAVLRSIRPAVLIPIAVLLAFTRPSVKPDRHLPAATATSIGFAAESSVKAGLENPPALEIPSKLDSSRSRPGGRSGGKNRPRDNGGGRRRQQDETPAVRSLVLAYVNGIQVRSARRVAATFLRRGNLGQLQRKLDSLKTYEAKEPSISWEGPHPTGRLVETINGHQGLTVLRFRKHAGRWSIAERSDAGRLHRGADELL